MMIFSEEVIKNEINEIYKKIDTKDMELSANSKCGKAAINRDKIQREIMQSYIKNDFIDDLRRKVEPVITDKIRLEYESIKKAEIENEKNELKKENINLDENTELDLDKKISDDEENVDVKALVIKAIYETEMKKYYTLKESLYTGKTGKLATGELSIQKNKIVELVESENLVIRLDLLYKANTGDFVSKDDEEISKEENKEKYNISKMENTLNEMTDDNLNNIKKMSIRLQNLEERMEILLRTNSNDKGFRQTMDVYQEEYLKTYTELNAINPGLDDYYKDAEDLEIQENYEQETIGTSYLEEKLENTIDEDNILEENKNEEIKNEIVENSLKLAHNVKEQKLETAEKLIEEAKKALPEDELEAEELIQNAELLSKGKITVEDSKKPKDKDLSEFEKECKSKTKNKKEIKEKDVAKLSSKIKNVEEKIKTKKNSKNMEI